MQRFAARHGGWVLAGLWVVVWGAIFATHLATPAPPAARFAQGFAMSVAAQVVPAFLRANTPRRPAHAAPVDH